MEYRLDILDKTLQELDGEDWGEPTFSSRLVYECHRLRTIQLKDFTVEDLRIMIGQKLSLDYLLPLALDHLEIDPWVSGDYYDGDLLSNILGLDSTFWIEHNEFKDRVDRVVTKALHQYVESAADSPYIYDKSVVIKLENWQ
jgi:hypothetical protein